MVNERWTYQVVEVKPAFMGSNRARVQEMLNQLGLQGWELAAVVRPHRFEATQLYCGNRSEPVAGRIGRTSAPGARPLRAMAFAIRRIT